MDRFAALGGLISVASAVDEPELAAQLLETSRCLLESPLGVAVLVDRAGTPTVLVHSGISTEQLAQLPHLPSPVGLISVVLAGQALRLDDIEADPRSAGLLNALCMRRMLAAPLWVDGRVVGAVFLARRGDEPVFEPAAEDHLGELCQLAAARIAALGWQRPVVGGEKRLGVGPGAAEVGAQEALRLPDPAPSWRAPGGHVIHLQPIVDLAERRAVGFEALSRFPDSRGACRSPEVVFDEATGLGLGLELEQRALHLALRMLPQLPPGSYLSVNLSPAALMSPAVFAALSAALGDHAGRLVVELTEHAEVRHYPALIRSLTSLRTWGLRLAVDDLGSGFASLRHVTMLHPDIIKLDRAFVRDIDLHTDRRAVARAMIAFADEIGAAFVAEGVETEAELVELVALGAALGQGYLLGRPAMSCPETARVDTR